MTAFFLLIGVSVVLVAAVLLSIYLLAAIRAHRLGCALGIHVYGPWRVSVFRGNSVHVEVGNVLQVEKVCEKCGRVKCAVFEDLRFEAKKKGGSL